jgi:GTPase Era involved in 16S rRNA processing
MSRLSHKVSAVSPKKNTTDEVIRAYKSFEIENEEGLKNVQLKYYDTPGLSQHKTGYLSRGWKVLRELDFTLLVIDSAKKFDDLVQESINRLEKHRQYEHFMRALVLNKIDLVENKRKFHGLIA